MRPALSPPPSSPPRRRFTVPFWKCTAAPTGRMTTAATRSEEIAVDGFTEKSRISMGVISAPPPAPVSPTSTPMTALAEYDVRIHEPLSGRLNR